MSWDPVVSGWGEAGEMRREGEGVGIVTIKWWPTILCSYPVFLELVLLKWTCVFGVNVFVDQMRLLSLKSNVLLFPNNFYGEVGWKGNVLNLHLRCLGKVIKIPCLKSIMLVKVLWLCKGFIGFSFHQCVNGRCVPKHLDINWRIMSFIMCCLSLLVLRDVLAA